MSRGAGKNSFSGWMARTCAARFRLILFLLLSTAVVPAARADSFAAGSRAYAAQNYVLSAEIFARLAEQGDPRAQTYLGVMYLRGQGVPAKFRRRGVLASPCVGDRTP